MISYRGLWANIASLGALQACNFALTLATLPYLARTLGVTGWGTVVFVQLVVSYLIWIANWGFYLGATKNISSERADKYGLTRIFMATWLAQWCLTVAALAFLLWGIFVLPMIETKKDLYLAAAGLLVGNVLMPLWFLNGLEKIRESAGIQIAVKLIALPFIFIFVKQEDDLATYLWINSISSLCVGTFVTIWLFRSRLVDFAVPERSHVLAAITNDVHFFFSSMMASLNSALVPTVLGIFGGPNQLGYFNLADRARSAAITILHPIIHALFPRMCYLYSKERVTAMSVMKYSAVGMIIFSLAISLTLWIFSEKVALVLGGSNFQEATVVLQWLALTPAITTASSFIIHQILIPAGLYRGALVGTLLSLLLTGVLAYPAVMAHGAYGGAAVVLATELFLALFLSSFVYRRRALVILGEVGKRPTVGS